MKKESAINIGDSVFLKTFNGTVVPFTGIRPENDYWKLIGCSGGVLDGKQCFSPEDRLLIKFYIPIAELGIACHNPIENSLWILRTDLSKIE